MKDLAKISALAVKQKKTKYLLLKILRWMHQIQSSSQAFSTAIAPGSRKTLFIMPEHNENVYKSFRNVPSVNGTLLSDINTYDIVNADTVVFTESAAKIFVEENEEENRMQCENLKMAN